MPAAAQKLPFISALQNQGLHALWEAACRDSRALGSACAGRGTASSPVEVGPQDCRDLGPRMLPEALTVCSLLFWALRNILPPLKVKRNHVEKTRGFQLHRVSRVFCLFLKIRCMCTRVCVHMYTYVYVSASFHGAQKSIRSSGSSYRWL